MSLGNNHTPAKKLEAAIVNQPVLVGGAMLTKLHSARQAFHTQVNPCSLEGFLTDVNNIITWTFSTDCPKWHSVVGVLSTAEEGIIWRIF